ncbi:MAG: CBS domain-containing protein [Deltaproteobacteria bacterium]|nr:CBS domain-containing protein [Deltaproteobacteria bacterium]
MKTIGEILQAKAKDIWVISPEVKVFEALKLMADKGVGALLVVDKGQVVGILSERDYARKVILKGKSSKNIPVRAIMTSKVYGVIPETKTEECMALMTDKHIRHLPVYEGDRLIGLVSIGDIVKSIISEQKIMIEHLTNFIMGKYM